MKKLAPIQFVSYETITIKHSETTGQLGKDDILTEGSRRDQQQQRKEF
jgi:hypothetical protein